MLRFRFLLLCLLMWTVPLQGIAAVSMQFCGVETSQTSQMQVSTGHHAAPEHHAQSNTTDRSSDDQKTLADVGHKCGVCAACCSAAVIFSIPHTPAVVALPSAMLVEPHELAYAVPPRHPEKPPRA